MKGMSCFYRDIEEMRGLGFRLTGEGLGAEEVRKAWDSWARLSASILFLFSSILCFRISSYDTFGLAIAIFPENQTQK